MTDSIQFGSKQIDFRLEYSGRKSLGITVTSDLNVSVKAPADTPIDKIKEKLRKKAPWIIKQQSFFLSFHPKTPERKFIGGETHLYLGRQYRLKIINDELGIINDSVKLKGQFIEVRSADKNKVKEMMMNWYLEKAKEKFHQIAKQLFDKFISKHNLSFITYH